MLEKLRTLNPEIEIFSVNDKEFLKYGRLIDDLDTTEILEVAGNIPNPESGSAYKPSLDEFESLDIAKKIKDLYFGTLPTQIGYCWGHNNLMNAMEWHFCSEINIATKPLVLILGDVRDIENGVINSSCFKAFYLPKGTAVEVYATTLHFCPCEVDEDGFGCVVGLAKGTNVDLEEKSKNPLLFRKNKWIICHEGNEPLIAKGIVPAIKGINHQIKFKEN